MEEYRRAKGLLFQQCRRAVLNLDDEAGRWYRERVKCPVFTYSENKAGAGLSARNIRLFPSHVEFEALTLGLLSRVYLPIPGGFSIYNALAALAAALAELLAAHFPGAEYELGTGGSSGETQLLRLDSGKAWKLLGWRALYTLEQTLAQAAAFQAGLAHTPTAQLCREQVRQYLDRTQEMAE